MTSIAAFFRKTPITRLQEYFHAKRFATFPPFDWTGPEVQRVGPLLEAVQRMHDQERQQVIVDAARVAALADEPGQTALQNVVINRAAFDPLEGASNRSFWVFLNEQERFRRAEEVRYNDEQRRGRWWSGFVVERGCRVRIDRNAVGGFIEAIRHRFETANVSIDIFDRHRIVLDGHESQLAQVAIYREGRPEDALSFDEYRRLARRVVKPVIEATMTYEANTGAIEVIATTRDDRQHLARLMAYYLLDIHYDERPLPLREYDLGVLLRPFDFPTDPADGIERVTVKELRLMDLGDPRERITLETMSGADRTIWEMARERIGLDIGDGRAVAPIGRVPQWLITRARFTIKFHPRSRGGPGRSLTLTVNTPHGCNLKAMTPQERLIGEKYLRRWNILKGDGDADAHAE